MKKRENSYWKQRFDQIEQAANNQSAEYLHELEEKYRAAVYEIDKKINAWYQRLAFNNDLVTISDAKKLLNKAELEEFKWNVKQYIKVGRENGINQKWEKELENASARFHINRLEALKLEIRQQVEFATGGLVDGVDDLLKSVYTDTFYKSCFEVQKGYGVGFDVSQLDDNLVSKLISKPWSVDGVNFSEKLWKNKVLLINNLDQELSRMILTGSSPRKAVKRIKKAMDSSLYAAKRLVYTEQAYFTSAAQKDMYGELDVEEYEFVGTLDNLMCEECAKLDGEHYPIEEMVVGVNAPPMHPFCRCTTCPYFEDEFMSGKRASRDEEGNTVYEVPENMTYQEWKEAFVEGSEEAVRALAIRKGNIYNINTVNGENIPDDVMKSIDKSIHHMFKAMPYLKERISEVIFEDLGNDIARAAISKDLNIRLKINSVYFSNTDILEKMLKSNPKELSLKDGLDGYLRHEFAHFQEYCYAIKRNTHNNKTDNVKAYEEIKQGIYAKELLVEALNTCKMEYTYDNILSISEYATLNNSETVAEAVSYCKNDNQLCETIKQLVKKKWSE